MGNHTWAKKEIFEFIDDAKYMIRPANFPGGTPGKGIVYININGIETAVINLQGRSFLDPLDDPFRKVDVLIEEAKKHTNIFFWTFMQKPQVKNWQWVCMLMDVSVQWLERIHIFRQQMNVFYLKEPDI